MVATPVDPLAHDDMFVRSRLEPSDHVEGQALAVGVKVLLLFIVAGRNAEDIGPMVDRLAGVSVKAVGPIVLLFESVHVTLIVAGLVPVGVPEAEPPFKPCVIVTPFGGVPV